MNGENRFISNERLRKSVDDGQIEDALFMPIAEPAKGDRLKNFLLGGEKRQAGQESMLYAGLTLGDFLYDYIRISPDVVEAVDFARSEDIDGILDFAYFAKQQFELSPEALQGSISQLQGYVAERLVAHHLEAQGYDVSFPDASNQEGWDILVDGKEFQVKCLADAAGVHEHLTRFDYPVIANSELADSVGHLDKVYIDPLLSRDEVRDLTEQTINNGAELTDFEIPWISLAVSSAAAMRDLVYGRSSLNEALTNVATNTAGRIIFGKLGSVATGSLGLFLFGPAGAVVGSGAGAIFGACKGRDAAAFARKYFLRDEERKFNYAARTLAGDAAAYMPQKLLAWHDKGMVVKDALSGRKESRQKINKYLQQKFSNDTAYYANKQKEIEKIARGDFGDSSCVELYLRLLELIKKAGIHPQQYQAQLKELNARFEELMRRQRGLKTE